MNPSTCSTPRRARHARHRAPRCGPRFSAESFVFRGNHGPARPAQRWHGSRYGRSGAAVPRLPSRDPARHPTANMHPSSHISESSLPVPPATRTRRPAESSPADLRTTCALAAATAASALLTPATLADDGPASRVNALVNFEFSTHYLTPRGMIVQDSGLVFQPLVLGFFNAYKGDGFINNFTIVGGVWNCFGSEGIASSTSNGAVTTSWYEIDPIAGISIGLAKHLTLDVTYTSFNMQIKNIPFSHHLETKLSIDDSAWLGKFALHPYLLFWAELDGKATAAQVPYLVDPLGKGPLALPDSSWYFEIGIAPSYTFEKPGLKIEAPIRALLPDKEFYGEYYADSSTIALWELGLKATMPLKFMPKGYGNWSAHVGFKHQHFEDENLASMQAFNAPGKRTDDVTMLYGGISIFF